MAKSSKRTENAYRRSFLNFVKRELNDTADVIQKEHLTDAICSSYIAAVWNSEPHIGLSTIRGNQSSIFHASFINLVLKPLKEQPENFVETINTIKGIKHDDRWKRHVIKKANIFTIEQILFMKNLPEESVEIHKGKVFLFQQLTVTNVLPILQIIHITII